MEIKILSQDDFKSYLEKYNISFKEIDKEILTDGTYNAYFNANGNIRLKDFIINFFIGAYAQNIVAPLNNAIIDFVTTTQQEITITTEEDQYKINPENVEKTIPILTDDIIATLNKEE